jgi:transposase InsO family protein
VGPRGDAHDNALAQTISGLYKTALIRKKGPWKNLDDVEYAMLEWVDWFNHRRLQRFTMARGAEHCCAACCRCCGSK